MSKLFSTPDYESDIELPSTMPDDGDVLAQRNRRLRRSSTSKGSSAASDRLTPVAGTIGREYSRQTLGAS